MPYAIPSYCIGSHLFKLVNAGSAAPRSFPKRNSQARVLSKEWLSSALSASAVLIEVMAWPTPMKKCSARKFERWQSEPARVTPTMLSTCFATIVPAQRLPSCSTCCVRNANLRASPCRAWPIVNHTAPSWQELAKIC